MKLEKIKALTIVLLCMIASMSALYFNKSPVSAVIAIGDEEITTTESSFTLNFNDDWISTLNISIDGMEINGSYSEYDTYIRNSNGNYYPVTGAGLQSAIYDLNSTDGGWVTLGGNFTISTSIYLVNNTLLDFQWHTVSLPDSAGFDMIVIKNNSENISIINGIFYGNRGGQAGFSNCTYVGQNCQRITIKDNIFYSWYGKAVTVIGGIGSKSKHIGVINNKMKDFQQGIDSDGVDFDQVNWGIISGNTIEGTGDDGIDVGSGDSVSICNNVLRDCKNGIELYSTKGEVVGNSIDKIADYGIVLDNCRTTTVTGNYLYAIGKHGIRCLYAYGCSITGNTFWRCSYGSNNTYDDIHLESSAGNHCTYNTITGNTIIEDYTNKPKCGINESDSNQNYNNICDNTIFGPYAIINTSGNHTIVKDNIGYNYNSLFPYYAQAIPPTMLENTTAYWYNTTGGWLYQVANSHGTQYYLNMSTTY